VVLTGATGFLGRALVRALRADGHDLVVLTRGPSRSADAVTHVQWTPDGTGGAWSPAIDGAQAAINLAGESIAGRRWTPAQKQRIFDSRILATRSLTSAIAAASRPPSVLISASAVGYYGPRGDEIVTEDTAPGSDFLAQVCQAWEAEAAAAGRSGVRVCLLRTGIVLERGGGALREMMRPFTMFVGGPVGSGRQYMPWIHRDDWTGIVRALLSSGSRGVFNLTAPNPVTNADFSHALGRAMRRPSFLPAPAFALKALLGAELAESLLLTGQRAVPARALGIGYQFKYASLDAALAAILR
jgi:uncharacterized protein (TIGR01777 family)